jgi:hypothetical protein
MVKPSCDVARRGDYQVVVPTHAEASAFIKERHYSRSTANTSVHRCGLVKDGRLVAACLWMPPTARAAKALAGTYLGSIDRHREVLTLSRLAVDEAEPQNAASILLGASTRDVLRDGRWHLLVTYADDGQGHSGTIYKATGWTAAGQTKPTAGWWRDGALISRKAGRSRTAGEMRAMGAVPRVSVKHRFIKVA